MNKKNIIILHGWNSNPERWDNVTRRLKDELSDECVIFTPILPGFDPKNPLKKPYAIVDYSNWLRNYIKKNHITNSIIIGHSNGGRIAICVAAHHQDIIDRLILIGAAGIPPQPSVKVSLFQLTARYGKKIPFILKVDSLNFLLKKFLYALIGEVDYFQASPIMKKTMTNLLAYNAQLDLPFITCETLCIWGRRDTDTPLFMGQTMVKKIKNARLVVINGGHNLHRTNEKELVNTIVSFLQK